MTGVEPVRCFHRGILSPLRLPIPPHQRMDNGVLEESRTLTRKALDSKSSVSTNSTTRTSWLRRRDLNPRPLGYEPSELPDCSTPLYEIMDFSAYLYRKIHETSRFYFNTHSNYRVNGGENRIRTCGTIARTVAFQATTFGLSDISPNMELMTGIEPATSCLQGKRSTN